MSKQNKLMAEFWDSSLEISLPFGFRHSSFQIVARPKMQAAEDAVAQFDFVVAQIGDGFKFLQHSRRLGKRRRYFGVIHPLALHPFPEPIGFERVGVKLGDKNGILAFAL